MAKQRTSFWQKIVKVYQQMFSLLVENPTIWLLFIIISVIDAAALIFLFLAPAGPVSGFLAPIIRTFWGERFLHYPDNFLLLPKLFQHAHFLILCVVGIVITGIVIKKIEAHTSGSRLPILTAAGPVFRKYFLLLVAWLTAYAVFVLAMKHLLPFFPRQILVQLGAAFLIGLAIQAFFAYLLPAILIQGRGFIKDLWYGIRFGIRYFPLTCCLIAVPMILSVILSYFKALSPVFIDYHPELVLWVLGIGIIVILVVDIWVTLTTTILYLKERDKT